ncbi:MAG: CpsD/CapB family tyrosine-protein kinase [Candidatus Rokuibacteriota bacterium]
MSKFFKALENAEREREAQQRAANPETPAPVATAPVAVAPATAPPEVSERRSPSSPAMTATVAPPAPRVAPPPAPSPLPPAYGAPTRRAADAAPAHRGAFTGLLEPPEPSEPGELDDHLVSLLAPTSRAAEQYRAVRLHIENLRRERDVRVIAVSSPARGDGKTVSAINIAGALAQAPDARVAVVEADVRHPGLTRYLGLTGGRGLSAYLLDHAMTVDEVLQRPPSVGFAVAVAGPATSMPYEVLKSSRLRALFATLRERFDFIVVDTPPVLPFPDVGLLRDLVDGFVMVVRANRTPREMVQDSLNALGTDRVLGAIFNDDERTGVQIDEADAGWRAYLSRSRGGVRAA